MQTAMNPVNPALAQVIGAMDTIKPVTPEGTPTVAAQVMQAAGMAQQPALPQIAQQAGLGGQIQAMQMQEAQKQLMNAAMQQQRQAPAGLMGLNPQMGNFAEGGIVGYAEAGVTRDSARESVNPLALLLRRLTEMGLPTRAGRPPEQDAIDVETARAMRAPVSEIPIPEIAIEEAAPARSAAMPSSTASAAAPTGGRPSVPTGVEALFDKERAEYAKIKGPATAQEILAREQMDRPTYEQFLRSRGIDPDMLTKRGEEDKSLIEQQRALLRERMEREQGRDTFLSRAGAAMRGFRQMKGQGIGDAVAGAHDNLARQLQAGEIRMDQFRDAELRLNELEITRRRALDDARRATAEGDWNRASQALATERAAANEIIKLNAPTYGKQATAMVQERQAQEAGAARRADQDRINELYRLRLNTLTGGKPPTDEQKMEAMEYALQTVKGAGSAARAAVAGQRLTLDQLRALQKTYADQAADTMLPKEQRAQAAQMLKQVNDEIAASVGIGASRTSGQAGTVLKFDERGNLIK